MILRGGSGGVIPGEQRETRNPGGIPTGKCLILLDASFRWHDEIEPIRINAMKHYFSRSRGECSTVHFRKKLVHAMKHCASNWHHIP